MRASLSVIIPVFNRRRFLREAVLSVLTETIDGIEVIVVDDGSTDGSLEALQDLPVIALRDESNRGVAHARNAGLSRATGGLVSFLDSDDVLVPRGMKWRVDWLRAHPEESGIAGTYAAIIDERGGSLPFRGPGFASLDRLSWQTVLSGGSYPVASPLFMFRREIVEQVGAFDETLTAAEDVDYLFRVLKTKSIAFRNRPVFKYRYHGENLSFRLHQGQLGSNLRGGAQTLLVYLSYGLPSPYRMVPPSPIESS